MIRLGIAVTVILAMCAALFGVAGHLLANVTEERFARIVSEHASSHAPIVVPETRLARWYGSQRHCILSKGSGYQMSSADVSDTPKDVRVVDVPADATEAGTCPTGAVLTMDRDAIGDDVSKAARNRT